MSKKRVWLPISVSLTVADLKKIDDLAQVERRSRSEVIRHAVDRYLSSHGTSDERENLLEGRMRKLEKRLADLTVLSARASAQTLYYMTLPYSRGGFPTRPLKEEAFKGQWEKSKIFATQFLRNASTLFGAEADKK